MVLLFAFLVSFHTLHMILVVTKPMCVAKERVEIIRNVMLPCQRKSCIYHPMTMGLNRNLQDNFNSKPLLPLATSEAYSRVKLLQSISSSRLARILPKPKKEARKKQCLQPSSPIRTSMSMRRRLSKLWTQSRTFSPWNTIVRSCSRSWPVKREDVPAFFRASC